MTQQKSPGQLLYEANPRNRLPWNDIGGLNRARWHVKAAKADVQAVRRATEKKDKGHSL